MSLRRGEQQVGSVGAGWVGVTRGCSAVALHGSGLCSLLAASGCPHPAHRTPEMLRREKIKKTEFKKKKKKKTFKMNYTSTESHYLILHVVGLGIY